jgi:hypothetical protein
MAAKDSGAPAGKRKRGSRGGKRGDKRRKKAPGPSPAEQQPQENADAQAEDAQGGSGGAGEQQAPEELSRSQLRDINATIRRINFPISGLRALLAQVSQQGLNTKSLRNKLACARLLLSAESLNLADESRKKPQELILRGSRTPVSADDQAAAILKALDKLPTTKRQRARRSGS